MKTYQWADAQKIITKGNIYLWMGSSWCSDCKVMEPVVAELEQKCRAAGLDIEFIAVDAEEAQLFRKPHPQYHVDYVPAHILMKNGKVVLTLYEIQTIETLYAEVLKLINL